MLTILSILRSDPNIKLISRILKKYPQDTYLVGGFLRDLFLKRRKNIPDFDLAISSSAIKISREIARKLKCGFVVLDEEHGSTRIVFRKGRRNCTFDFTDFRGKDILNDLLHRDFTINSMAVDLRLLKNSRTRSEDILIDRYGAKKDIKNKIIRIISHTSFSEDYLRILRAFSLSAILDFKIEPKTMEAIKKYRGKITSCAFERITEELFKILNSENCFNVFSLMDSFGILERIIPELKIMRTVDQGPYHHLDVYNHSLETLRQIEILFSALNKNTNIENYLNEVVSGTHTRRALVKLGALLHDIGKPEAVEYYEGKIRFHGHERIGRDMVRDIAEKLRLSNDERQMLQRMVFWHLRPGYLADIEHISKKAIFRYFRDTAGEAVSIFLLSIADQRATRGPLTKNNNRRHHEEVCFKLIKEFFHKAKEKKIQKLINGHDLIKHLKLASGPLIGKILKEIEEAQGVGEVHTKKQALELAKKLIKEK